MASSTPGGPRVALVAAGLDILGGQGVQADVLIKRLRSDGYRVQFLPINPAFPRGLRWLRRIPYARTLLNQLLYLPSLARLANADIVHVFSASYWSFVLAPLPAMVVARLLGKRVILHYHSGEAGDHLAHWGLLVHPWLRLADTIVVPSGYLKHTFASFDYESHVVPNVVELGQFSYRIRDPLEPRFLSVRNLEVHYGVDCLIRAFARIRAVRHDASLIIAGYGSQEGALRMLVRDLSLDGVRFVGRVEPEAIAELYDRCDIFLNASTIDNQPVSLLEAFAAGLPVITTGTGDIANMVCGGAAGIIVPHSDPAALADAALALLEQPAIAVSLARRARCEVERYTWRQVAPQWASVYGEAAS